MIIQIRGTSGSGKSHIVRGVLDAAESKARIKLKGRRQPYGYMLNGKTRPLVFVPGHYETACGGCDTLPGHEGTFTAVNQAVDTGERVLFEGLLASEEVRRSIELYERVGDRYKVILLTTPVDDCLASIRKRREARGDDRPLKEDNTRNRVRTIERACDRLRKAGIQVYPASRDEAAALVRELLA